MTPRERWKAEAMALDQPTRQAFLDHVKDGKTIGEAREAAGISFDAAMGCMDMFIVKNEFFSLVEQAP